MLKLNQKAPAWSLPDASGKKHRLADFAGKWVLIYFYPKDDTPGCTKEACNFRDNFSVFNMLKTEIIGISSNNQDSHQKFAAKYRLPFILLSDPEKKVISKYGVWRQKTFMGKKFMGIVRSSFLIDPQGKIAKIYPKVNPLKHASEVIADLKSLK